MYLRELGLSNKEIEEIVEKYTVEGRSVAKITGAGMGGVVLIVG
jgi:mevalonate kinase